MSKSRREFARGIVALVSLSLLSMCIPSRVDAQPPPGPDRSYDELDRLAAELDKTAKLFEAVARVVSPAVVQLQSKRNVAVADRTFTYTESGSGVIIVPPTATDPYVLTSFHVIDKATPEQIVIKLADGRVLTPKRVLGDSRSDVAVLELPVKDLPTARLGDSDKLQVGHWVLAIGSPFELSGSVTHGIISAKGRRSLELPSNERNKQVINQDFLQTDASINPGNSGGPLVNLRGEVVGINTAIASTSGANEGVGFAIPMNLARRVLTELFQKGSVTRAYIGVYMDPPLTARTAVRLGLERARGALVSDVFPRTPAAQAGLRHGDVVLEIEDKPIEDEGHLTNLVSMSPVGSELRFVVWRERKRLALKVRVGDRDEFDQFLDSRRDDRAPPAATPLVRFGIQAREITETDRNLLDLHGIDGLLVTAIVDHCSAAQFVDRFDVIDQVERQPVDSLNGLGRVLAQANTVDGVLLRVVRKSSGGRVVRQLGVAAPFHP